MLKVGSNSIGKVYLGSNLIGKAYLGSNLVYQSGSSPTPPTPPVGNTPYIRGGVGSYIDTGITADDSTRVIVWARNFNPNSVVLFGSRVGGTNQAFGVFAPSAQYSGSLRFDYGSTQNIVADAFSKMSGYHKYELDGNKFYVDAIQQGSAPALQAKTATPSTSQQVISPDNGYDGLSQVTLEAVSAAIDANITAGNIKKDVSILGVTGTYEGSGGGSTLTPTAGDYPVVGNGGLGGGGSNLTSTGISVTIPVTGTYRFKWCAFRRNNSTSYSWSSRLYRTRSGQTTAIGTENSTWQSTYIQTNSQDIQCNAGDVITVYVRGRSNSYSWGGMLTACVAQKLWTN